MEYVTIGREIYPGMVISLFCDSEYKFDQDCNACNLFRLIIIEEGSGIAKLNNKRFLLNAPSLLCVSETESLCLEQGSNIKAKSLYFHPCAVNSNFNFSTIRNNNNALSPTEVNDCTCLQPYYTRTSEYAGYLNIGPLTLKRMLQLFDLINNELTRQKDEFWPCRGRSYFLELLFIVERIYFNPEITKEPVLPDHPNDIDSVILYLHTNYQKKITIEELTKSFHINRNTLRERFEAATGMSVLTYLINLRLRIAALILKDTTVPVSEIVDRVGFNDNTNFGRAFRKAYGCSPTEYRQEYCWLLKG
ncbi:helix-turn-helix domain-containing protein [Acetivibrio cellulolyticus]|uniref:helix-turn-helix domain-containing protein n=1 Tax=Acetivibrio cellulolyticus TaxID=35830 RepID=UPI0001E2F5C5|nr:AraC family transcriptional regulator [Acetivibrio cellulolyticus]